MWYFLRPTQRLHDAEIRHPLLFAFTLLHAHAQTGVCIDEVTNEMAFFSGASGTAIAPNFTLTCPIADFTNVVERELNACTLDQIIVDASSSALSPGAAERLIIDVKQPFDSHLHLFEFASLHRLMLYFNDILRPFL